MKSIILLLSILLLSSCAYQNKLKQIKSQTELAKERTTIEKEQVAQIVQKINEKNQLNELDSLSADRYLITLRKLESNLEKINLNLVAINTSLANNAYFNREKYLTIKSRTTFLDSFQINQPQREAIYQLLSEAVKAKSYNLYSLAAFFDPGVYKIKDEVKPALFKSFYPIIDSFSNFSEKHKTVPHTIYLVFVGYADGSNIVLGSNLYNDLKKYIPHSNPTNADLNITLSELRASQLSSNMRELINSQIFTKNKEVKKIGYYYYGRGEALPFPNITDYHATDDRRRIVLCYWSVIPELTN